jgi:hypothetical protein
MARLLGDVQHRLILGIPAVVGLAGACHTNKMPLSSAYPDTPVRLS